MPEHARKTETHKNLDNSLSFSYKKEKIKKSLPYTHSNFQISRKMTCPCDGGCPRCTSIQAKLRIGESDDEYEKEADRVAKQVMRMPDPILHRKKCPLKSDTSCKEDEEETPKGGTLMKKGSSTSVPTPIVPSIVSEVLGESGETLDMQSRAFFEPRFGYEFGNVRVHTGEKAEKSARSINALAYTFGRDIVFGDSFSMRGSAAGQELLAHELSHVIQQKNNPAEKIHQWNSRPDVSDREAGHSAGKMISTPDHDGEKLIRRRARDVIWPGNLCMPFQYEEEAKQTLGEMKDSLIPFITTLFGSEVGDLWSAYLNRRKGASLVPRVYKSPESSIVQGFAMSWATLRRIRDLADLIISDLERTRSCPELPDTEWAELPVENFLPYQELNSTGPDGKTDSDIDYGRIGELPGNIAGGVGSSDAGPDTRRVTGNIRLYRVRDEAGNMKQVKMQTDFVFIVEDAVDFCPGQPGAPPEWQFTIPLSRLEVSGYAYDVPFKVIYKGPTVERTLPDFIANCWQNPSKQKIPFNFTIQARLPQSRLFYVSSNGKVTVHSYAQYDASDLPAGVGSKYYIGIRRLGMLFDSNEGNYLFTVGKNQSHTWTGLDPGNYYLEIWKDEPGVFSPYVLRGEGFINIL